MGKTDLPAKPTRRQFTALRNHLRKAFAGPQAPDDPWLDGSFTATLERLVPPRRDDPLRQFLDDLWAQRPSRLPWLLRPTATGGRTRDLDWHERMQAELERFARRPALLLLAPEVLAGLEDQARRLGEGDAVFQLRASRERLGATATGEAGTGPRPAPTLPSPGVLLVQRSVRRLWLAGFHLLEPDFQKSLFGALWFPAEAKAKAAWRDALTAAHAGIDPGIRVDPVLPVLDLGGADIEGNSFGLALWLFTWLHLQHAPLPEAVAATGNVRPDGRVTAVAAATFDLKISLALHAGYGHLFVPADNVGAASPWRGDRRVVPVSDVAQVRDWVADHDPAVQARRRVTWFLRDRTEAALPPLAPLIRRQVTGDGLPALVRDWMAQARRHGAGRESLLAVLDRLRGEFAGLFGQGDGLPVPDRHEVVGAVSRPRPDRHEVEGARPPRMAEPTARFACSQGPDPWELAALQAILPERVWLVFLPYLLFALARDRAGQLAAEALYQRARERLFDHDADLQMAGRALEPLFDRATAKAAAATMPDQGDAWVQTWFRRRFPGLVWMFFHEPLEAVARLLSLPERTAEEDRALAGFLEILAETDAARYAALDVTERDVHHHPMRRAVARHLGEFQPAIAPPPTFRERLALLWRILVRLPGDPAVAGRGPGLRETQPPTTAAGFAQTAGGAKSAKRVARHDVLPTGRASPLPPRMAARNASFAHRQGTARQAPGKAEPPAAERGNRPHGTAAAWLEAHLRCRRPYDRPPLAHLFPTLLPLLLQVPTTAAAFEALAGAVKDLAAKPGGAVLDTLSREIRDEARRVGEESRLQAGAGEQAPAGSTTGEVRHGRAVGAATGRPASGNAGHGKGAGSTTGASPSGKAALPSQPGDLAGKVFLQALAGSCQAGQPPLADDRREGKARPAGLVPHAGTWAAHPVRAWLWRQARRLAGFPGPDDGADDPPGLSAFCQPAFGLLEAARADPTGLTLAGWPADLQAWTEDYQSAPRITLTAQCLAHLAGRVAGSGGGRFPFRAQTPRKFVLPLLAGWLGERPAAGCDECRALQATGTVNADQAGPLWAALLPSRCRACPELQGMLADQAARWSEAVREDRVMERGQSECGLGLLYLLGLEPPDLTRDSAVLARQIVGQWGRAGLSPTRRYQEGLLPLLAVLAGRPTPPERLSAGLEPAWRRPALRRILRASRGSAGYSPFALAYVALLHPDSAVTGWLGIGPHRAGSGLLWDSAGDRQLFHTALVIEAWRRHDRRTLHRLLPRLAADLPNLFLVVDLLAARDPGHRAALR